jgi:hypothetical protein
VKSRTALDEAQQAHVLRQARGVVDRDVGRGAENVGHLERVQRGDAPHPKLVGERGEEDADAGRIDGAAAESRQAIDEQPLDLAPLDRLDEGLPIGIE